jgi:hypothetical protein
MCVYFLHTLYMLCALSINPWAEELSGYSDWLRAGRSGDQIPVGASFSAPVQTGPSAHPASCTMGTRSLLGVESGRGVTLTPHPLLAPRSEKQSSTIPILSLRAFVTCKKCETYRPLNPLWFGNCYTLCWHFIIQLFCVTTSLLCPNILKICYKRSW